MKYEHEQNGDRWSGSLFRSMGPALVELLYPRRCPFCHEIVPVMGKLICPDCEKIVADYYVIREPACARCGKSLGSMETEYCSDCRRHHRSFDGGISLFRYGLRNVPEIPGRKPGYETNSMGESVLRFKYDNAREYADFYVEQAIREHSGKLALWHPDVIIPVPVHPSKKKQRGYNQAEVLARRLGAALDIPVCTDVLVRREKTKPQKELNDEERMKNLKAAFAIDGIIPDSYRRILLVDDIYTTGSTMEVCTRRLLEQGPRKVFVLSVCSGQNAD